MGNILNSEVNFIWSIRLTVFLNIWMVNNPPTNENECGISVLSALAALALDFVRSLYKFDLKPESLSN